MSKGNGVNNSEEIHHGQPSNTAEDSYNKQQTLNTDENQNKAILMMFVLPIVLSAVFCLADCVELINNFSSQTTPLEFGIVIVAIVDLLLGYFPVTFISTVAAALLQQLLYKVDAGLEKTKVAGLFVFFIIYIVAYSMYLALKIVNWDFPRLLVLGLTVGFGVWMWRALTDNVRNAAARTTNSNEHFRNNTG